MIWFAVDALTVFLLLKALSGKETGFWTAGLIGLVGVAVTMVISINLTSAIGYMGLVATIPIAGALLGLSLAWFCGVKLKAACVARTIFATVHITTCLLIQWMHGRL
jgi:hypothetical protein